MIKLKEAIIVEGKYDKIKLSSIVDALIIDVGGFAIFNNKEKVQMIKQIADQSGVIILTDSDAAGFIIRNYLSNVIPKNKVKHAYVPDVYGKEKRKQKPSGEGKLGVEGLSTQIILDAIKKASPAEDINQKEKRLITAADLYRDGFSGRENSKIKRNALVKKLNLPEHISQKALIKVLNTLITYEDYLTLIKDI